jgi:hypothetical protein
MVADAHVIDVRIGDPTERHRVRLSRTLERTDRSEYPYSNVSHANP